MSGKGIMQMDGARASRFFETIFGKPATRAPAAAAAEADRPRNATDIFKTLGHEGRLALLCHLAGGEKSVTELEGMLDARQSAVSQQLARLRMEGMVQARREGQTIYYSIKDRRITELLSAFGAIFEYEQPSGP